MKLSIVVPIYNGEQYISRCLESIRLQTFTDYECLLIDDGSTDKSLLICKRFSDMDSRFIVYSKKNEGVSCTRNFGISFAKGDWISFIDIDDYLDVNLYTKAFNVINNQTDYVQFGISILQNNQTVSTFLPPEKNLRIGDNCFFPSWMHGPYSRIYRLQFLKDKSIFFPEHIRLAEDLYFSFLVILSAETNITIQEPLYYYVQNTTSVMHTLTIEKIFDEVAVIRKLEERIYSLVGTNNKIGSIIELKKIEAKDKFLYCFQFPLLQEWREIFPEVNFLVLKKCSFFKFIIILLILLKFDSAVLFLYRLKSYIRRGL